MAGVYPLHGSIDHRTIRWYAAHSEALSLVQTRTQRNISGSLRWILRVFSELPSQFRSAPVARCWLAVDPTAIPEHWENQPTLSCSKIAAFVPGHLGIFDLLILTSGDPRTSCLLPSRRESARC